MPPGEEGEGDRPGFGEASPTLMTTVSWPTEPVGKVIEEHSPPGAVTHAIQVAPFQPSPYESSIDNVQVAPRVSVKSVSGYGAPPLAAAPSLHVTSQLTSESYVPLVT